jgi:thiol-disulfide isomerase/thioredoxin
MDKKYSVGDLRSKISGEGALMVYFYSDSCAPCLHLRPKVVELIRNYFPEMKLIKIDAESQRDLAAAYSAFSLPVLLVFFGGKEFFRYSKYVSVSEMRKDIARIYKIYFT